MPGHPIHSLSYNLVHQTFEIEPTLLQMEYVDIIYMTFVTKMAHLLI